jgi:hypothetical protein
MRRISASCVGVLAEFVFLRRIVLNVGTIAGSRKRDRQRTWPQSPTWKRLKCDSAQKAIRTIVMLNVPIDEVLIRIKLDVANWARETHRITKNTTKRRLGRRVRWLWCRLRNFRRWYLLRHSNKKTNRPNRKLAKTQKHSQRDYFFYQIFNLGSIFFNTSLLLGGQIITKLTPDCVLFVALCHSISRNEVRPW